MRLDAGDHADACPHCGAAHIDDPGQLLSGYIAAEWVCGTWQDGDGDVYRSGECRERQEVAPHDGGCWYCHTADENLVFSIEWDAYVHLACVREALERDPQDAEAWVFARELGVDLIEEEVEANA